MASHSFSRAAYRCLLRACPREFRERFADDLQADFVEINSPAPWHTVIGLAGDVVDGAPGSEPVIHVYVPYTEVSDAVLGSRLAGGLRRFVIAVNADGDARALAGSARAAIAALDPALPVSAVQTIAQLERDRSAPQRFSALVVTGFGGVALLLAAIGLYGVLAFVVSQRRREIGVRQRAPRPDRGDAGRVVPPSQARRRGRSDDLAAERVGGRRHVLRATCYVLRATCYVLRAFRATCQVPRAKCSCHVLVQMHSVA